MNVTIQTTVNRVQVTETPVVVKVTPGSSNGEARTIGGFPIDVTGIADGMALVYSHGAWNVGAVSIPDTSGFVTFPDIAGKADKIGVDTLQVTRGRAANAISSVADPQDLLLLHDASDVDRYTRFYFDPLGNFRVLLTKGDIYIHPRGAVGNGTVYLMTDLKIGDPTNPQQGSKIEQSGRINSFYDPAPEAPAVWLGTGTYPSTGADYIGINPSSTIAFDNFVRFMVNSSTMFQVSKDGRIQAASGFLSGPLGLGTPSPTQMLDVVGNVKLTGSIMFSDGTTLNTAPTSSGGVTSGLTIGEGDARYLQLTGGLVTGVFGVGMLNYGDWKATLQGRTIVLPPVADPVYSPRLSLGLFNSTTQTDWTECLRIGVAANPNEGISGTVRGDPYLSPVSGGALFIQPMRFVGDAGMVGINVTPTSETLVTKAVSEFHTALKVMPKQGVPTETDIFVVTNNAAQINFRITQANDLELFRGNLTVYSQGGYVFATDRATGNLGVGTASPLSKLSVKGGDIEVETNSNGVILRSPGGMRYKVVVSDSGVLSVQAV